MRTVKEIQEEIRKVEEEQAETEFSSVGWDFYNAEIIGLEAELSRAQSEVDNTPN